MATQRHNFFGLMRGLDSHSIQPQTHKPRFDEECRFYNCKTGCMRGNLCWFRHSKNTSTAAVPPLSNTNTDLLQLLLKNQTLLLEQNKQLLHELNTMKCKFNMLEMNCKKGPNNCAIRRDTARPITPSTPHIIEEKKEYDSSTKQINDEANKSLNNITNSHIAGLPPATIQTTKADIPTAQKTELLLDRNKDINFEKMIDITYPLNDKKAKSIHEKYMPKNKNKQGYIVYLNHMNNNEDITLDEYNYLLQVYRENREKLSKKSNNKSNKNKTKFNNKRNKKNRK